MPRKKSALKTAKPEDSDLALQLYLKDFDKSVLAKQTELKKEAAQTMKDIKTMFAVATMQLPPSAKNSKIESFEATWNLESDSESAQMKTKPEDDGYEDIDSRIKNIEKSAKGNRGRGKKGASSAVKASEPPVRKSARKGAKADAVLATPVNRTGANANLGKTPMITPKFNTATPWTKTVTRKAEPNEMLVSLSGSPVMPIAAMPRSKGARSQVAAAASNMATIPLGDKKTLNMPLDDLESLDPNSIDLDESQLNRLRSLHESLANMLKARL